jgi:hypothetical protein
VTGAYLVVAAVGLAIVAYPARKAAQCLVRARQLVRWRRPSIEGLDGQRATLCGDVRVIKPMRNMGDCLWQRRLVREHLIRSKSQSSRIVSDVSIKAKFSIVIGGRECVIADRPTHVYGAHYRRTHEGICTIFTYWLPVVGQLTVLGRVREKGSRYVIEKDPKVGLIYSTHSAEHTAVRESVKGLLCLLLAAAGAAAFYVILSSIP